MEQYIYHNRYGLGEYTTEEPLCVVATGRSPELLQTYQQFFDSLFRQNYTDYAVVFGHLNFDGETDAKMKKYIEEKEGDFAKKFRTFRDYSEPMKQGLFQIKYELIKNYCKEGELIVDVDAGDELIGIQALGLINTVFQANPELWFLIANSLYEDPEEDEKNRILPASPKDFKFFWDLFHYDKVKVLRKPFFESAVSHFSEGMMENEACLRMFQLSGSRFYFLSEFLSFDYRTELYSPLSSEEKYNLFQILSQPYNQLSFDRDKKQSRTEISLDGGLPFQNTNSLLFFKRLLDSEEISEKKNNLEEEKMNFFLDSVMEPLENPKDKRKDSMYLFYRLK